MPSIGIDLAFILGSLITFMAIAHEKYQCVLKLSAQRVQLSHLEYAFSFPLIHVKHPDIEITARRSEFKNNARLELYHDLELLCI